MGRPRKYQTEEERIAARKEKRRASERLRYHNNKEKYIKKNAAYRKNNPEYWTEWYQKNKEEVLSQQAEYHSTQFGRAVNLLSKYKYADNKYNRGECTLTADWIMENIFSQPCHYCGETDWHELGCDRIDNNLPHTPDNVVPCCYHCNCKRNTTPYDEFMKKIGKIA